MSLRVVQARLVALGFDAGTPDGRWGRMTEAAVNAALDLLQAREGPTEPETFVDRLVDASDDENPIQSLEK